MPSVRQIPRTELVRSAANVRNCPTLSRLNFRGRPPRRPRARADLVRRGVEVSDVFHRDGGQLLPGPDPERRSYLSYASFSDPDGNSWLLQEVRTRLPGRMWDD